MLANTGRAAEGRAFGARITRRRRRNRRLHGRRGIRRVGRRRTRRRCSRRSRRGQRHRPAAIRRVALARDYHQQARRPGRAGPWRSRVSAPATPMRTWMRRSGWFTVQALTTRARVALAQNEFGAGRTRCPRGAGPRGRRCGLSFSSPTCWRFSALWPATPVGTWTPPGSSARRQAFGERIGVVRFRIYDAGYAQRFRRRRNALGETGV